jgi:CDP-glucose 4,6-dehydratase
VDRPDHSAPHEANLLRLDCTLLRRRFGWQPVWEIGEAVARTCEWTRVWAAGGDVPAEMDRQIAAFWADGARKQAE